MIRTQRWWERSKCQEILEWSLKDCRHLSMNLKRKKGCRETRVYQSLKRKIRRWISQSLTWNGSGEEALLRSMKEKNWNLNAWLVREMMRLWNQLKPRVYKYIRGKILNSPTIYNYHYSQVGKISRALEAKSTKDRHLTYEIMALYRWELIHLRSTGPLAEGERNRSLTKHIKKQSCLEISRLKDSNKNRLQRDMSRAKVIWFLTTPSIHPSRKPTQVYQLASPRSLQGTIKTSIMYPKATINSRRTNQW